MELLFSVFEDSECVFTCPFYSCILERDKSGSITTEKLDITEFKRGKDQVSFMTIFYIFFYLWK